MRAEPAQHAGSGQSTATRQYGGRSVVVMGVSGVGKTTVGRLLAERLGRSFIDADDLHDDRCKEKMAQGQALTDADRMPWLDRVGEVIRHSPAPLVIACSALKRAYRSRLRRFAPNVAFVHLDGPATIIAARLGERTHEYMSPALLGSQLETLESLQQDERGLEVDIARSPSEIVDRIVDWAHRAG